MKHDIAVIGAGFSGAVVARELAETERFWVHVFDERHHVAGNCHTERDAETGIMLHVYGPHIFNTHRRDVWDYVQRWGKFHAYINRVKVVTAAGVFSLPINLHTINQFFNKRFNPREAQEFLAQQGDSSILEPRNFEEQALKFLGEPLYRNFFYGYTKKQWGVEPRELPASILKRLPVRFNYDDNYYNMPYQGIPEQGYTRIVERILDHPAIKVSLGTAVKTRGTGDYAHTFYTGPLDAWFDYQLGRLQYRTLNFDRFSQEGDFQGNAVINYCEESVPHTRISEHKHFAPWEPSEKTVCYRETSRLAAQGDTLYYPLRLAQDRDLLQKYVDLADQERGVTFLGRLATYRYLDMHMVIGEALDLCQSITADAAAPETWPRFSVRPV